MGLKGLQREISIFVGSVYETESLRSDGVKKNAAITSFRNLSCLARETKILNKLHSSLHSNNSVQWVIKNGKVIPLQARCGPEGG